MYICSECKKECNVRVVDEGIGPYEFWGAKCVDHRPVLVSTCCDAEVEDDYGRIIDVVDYEEGLRDAEADEKNDERWLKEHE